MARRRIYENEIGDTWDLVNLDNHVRVVHRSGLVSGGSITDYDLVAFLSLDRQSPQNRALVALIGALAADEKGSSRVLRLEFRNSPITTSDLSEPKC